MKRYITLLFLLILLPGLLTGCDSPDAKYRPSEQGYKWVCDEIDMWFLIVGQGQNRYFIGELTVDDENKTVRLIFSRGSNASVYEFVDFDDLTLHGDSMIFGSKGQFRDGWFTLKVREEYIDRVGFEELTFNRLELDEEDFDWVKSAYPELIVDEEGIRVY